MLGYNDLKGPSVSGFFRLLARFGDNVMKMQIVRLDFFKPHRIRKIYKGGIE